VISLRAILPLAMVALLPLSAAEEKRLLVEVVENYCADCHDADSSKGDIDFTAILGDEIGARTAVWEKALRQLDARQMPPIGKDRPDTAGYDAVVSLLAEKLDAAAMANPNPGRTDTLRRLNRTEYRNAIRDLLALDIDAAALLPADESSHGFDNVTVGELSPTLLDRYITAAQKISRLAVGTALRIPAGDTIRIRPDITQEGHVEGLPLGTRGGALIPHTFPRDGDYDIEIRLARDRNEQVEGLRGKHALEVLLDDETVSSFTVQPPKNRADQTKVDAHLKGRISVKAGPHALGVTFRRNGTPLEETLRQPYSAHFNTHRHPRLSPAVYQISITGPYDSPGVGEMPSRQRIFTAIPATPGEEENCAEEILGQLARRAFRRPVEPGDLEGPLGFYREAREEGENFEAGIESALTAILVSREFLFRVEKDPADLAPGTAYALSDLELASRLSFFLWSSIPDETLLAVAERGALREPGTLEKQTRRMLDDPRASSLVTNFADQWLYLRNLDSITPDGRLFPDFDDNLRQAFRRETELLFETVLREDRSVLDLLRADFTFLNERLAEHYGIPHIYGDRFRKVALQPESRRGGLLRHGSILTVTSYATRTSPVIRGHWILKNLLGTPPPPPPPNVPALEDNTVSASLPMRERLAEHRANVACASCHNVMDPVGFALENFDAVGRWRTMEEGQPVDASGGLPDGSSFTGVEGLEAGLLARPEVFVRTLTEKLLTFALGRGMETSDAPSIRGISRAAKAEDYRFSALVLAIVRSEPFTMRRSAPERDE
jgi:hypothetical protein